MSKRRCKFSDSLKQKYKMFKPGEESWKAKCEVCNQVISIAYKGKADLEKHLETNKHKKRLQNIASTSKMDYTPTRVANVSESHSFNVPATEATLVYHTIRHHQSFNSLNCTTLCKCIYSDLHIAKDMSCCCKKAEVILKYVLGPYALQTVLNDVSKIRYISATTDVSNHSTVKMFPLLIQYFNPTKGGIQVYLLDIKANEPTNTISSHIYNVLNEKNLLDKLVAFSADNTTTNFGDKDQNSVDNVYYKLKSITNNDNIVGVGCIAHIFNNSVYHALASLPISLEGIFLQLHNYFATFTVRTAALKGISDQLEIYFKQMLFDSKTRWLLLCPTVEKILQTFEQLKVYFLSLKTAPRTLKMFFEDDLNECYLYISLSFMSIYQNKIKHNESKNISVNELIEQCSQIVKSLNERLEQKFCPIKVLGTLRKLEGAQRDRVNEFKENLENMFKIGKEYIQNWMHQLDTELKHFQWMTLTEDLTWEKVADTIEHLSRKNVTLDDGKFFDQFQNFKNFIQQKMDDSDFRNLLAHEKWSAYFNSMSNSEYYSELLILAEYYFAIPGHNANTEKVFSLINILWSKDTNNLDIDTITKMMFLHCNMKLTCQEFYKMISMENDVLDKLTLIGSGVEYLKIINIKTELS